VDTKWLKWDRGFPVEHCRNHLHGIREIAVS
jgi:hypothetical protein